ncbi:MAG: EamA family transporter [Oscillospiraceae bacterium]|nr:EamA family transporter [Oscillospiraceae bacterium]
MKEHSSKLGMIAAMAVFGTIGLFKRQIPLTSGEIALYRAVLAAALIIVVLLCTKKPIRFSAIKKELPLLLLSGAAMGFNWILLFEAYEYTTVSVATLSYYFAPVLVTVASPVLFREKLGAKQWICSLMATVGIVLITGIGDLSGGSSHLVGIGFGLGAAVLYASVVLLNKYIKNVSGIHRTLLQFMAAIVVLVPYVLLTGPTQGFIGTKGLVFMLIVGLVHTGIAYCLYFSAMKDLSSQKVAILSYIDPLVAVLLSALVLKEPMGTWQIVGGIMILGFTLLNEIEFKKRTS